MQYLMHKQGIAGEGDGGGMCGVTRPKRDILQYNYRLPGPGAVHLETRSI